jgi:SAM-dependent methyltransferase
MKERLKLVQRVDLITEICRDKRVLHLGCTNYPFTDDSIKGNMLLHFELEKYASEIYGFDFDQQGLDILQSRGINNLYRADLEHLEDVPLAETFDVIIAGEIIEHLSNPGLFLSGVKRFMRPDTRLVLTTINAYCAMRFVIYTLRGKGGSNEPVHPDHVSYYSYKTLTLLLERNSFAIDAFYFYDVGREHRAFARWIYLLVNDICVRLFPHLSDGVVTVVRLK